MKQKIKQKNYNLELRLKREQQKIELRDFPLSVRIKPTAHKQYCYLCRKPIGKDTHQIMLNSGYWYTFVKDSKVQGGFRSISTIPSPYYTSVTSADSGSYLCCNRKIYLHADCYACIFNRMMAKMGLSHLVNQNVCDKCEQRFNCYSGNLPSLEEMSYRAYTPSGKEHNLDDKEHNLSVI